MLKVANTKLAQQNDWIVDQRNTIDSSLAKLDRDFDKLLPKQ